MKQPLMIAISLAIAVCSGHLEKCDRTLSKIDHSQPFWLEFGRGSGLYGLSTVKLDQTGRVVCHRMKEVQRGEIIYHTWEVAMLHLLPEEVAEVMAAVESSRLRDLNKSYQDLDICDGNQWILWLRQEDCEKSVYFNNKFPRAITEFAKNINAILMRAGLDREVWQPIPPGENREYERELWDSIRR